MRQCTDRLIQRILAVSPAGFIVPGTQHFSKWKRMTHFLKLAVFFIDEPNTVINSLTLQKLLLYTQRIQAISTTNNYRSDL